MVTNELRSYISAQIAKGRTKAQLRSTLLAAGWSIADTDTALAEVPAPPMTAPVPKSTAEAAHHPHLVHRLAGVLIAISGCILLALVFFYVSKTTLKDSASTSTTETLSKTVNRTTYSNKDQGFSFDYPNDWKVESDKSSVTVTSPATQASQLYKQQGYGDAMVVSAAYSTAADAKSHLDQAQASALSYATDHTTMQVRYSGLDGYASVVSRNTLTALIIVLSGNNLLYTLQFPNASSLHSLTVEQLSVLNSFRPLQ